TRTSLHVAIENWQHDFNIGTIVRSANAFNIETVHIIGKRQWNRRGAMVTDRYLNIEHHSTVDEYDEKMRTDERVVTAIDIIPGAKPLSESKLPARTVLVFGGEGPGLSAEMQSIATQTVM